MFDVSKSPNIGAFLKTWKYFIPRREVCLQVPEGVQLFLLMFYPPKGLRKQYRRWSNCLYLCFNFALVIVLFLHLKFFNVTDGGWWMVVVDGGGWVPKRFSDFAQNFVRWSSQYINLLYFGKSAKKFFCRKKNPTSSFKIGGIFRKKMFPKFLETSVIISLI